MADYRHAAICGCLIAFALICEPVWAQTTERVLADERAQSAPARIDPNAQAPSPSAGEMPPEASSAETEAAERAEAEAAEKAKAEAVAAEKAKAEAAAKAEAEAAEKAKAEAVAAEKAKAEAAAKAEAEAEAAEKARAEAAAKAEAEAEAAEKARAEAAEKARAEAAAKAKAEAEAAEKARAETAAKAKAEAEAAEKARAAAAARAKAEAEAAEKARAETAAKAKAEAEAAEKARAETAAKAKAEAEAAEKARAEAEAAEKAKAEAAAKPQDEVTGALTGTPGGPPASGRPLVIASWGGAYQDGQAIALFKPFEESGKGRIDAKKHGGGQGILDAAATEGWDVVDLSKEEVAAACSRGLLVRIAPIDLPPGKDGEPAQEDFLPGAIHDCGIGSVAWAHAIVYDAAKVGKRGPTTAADFFDLKRFPGKRALRKTPRYTLELALLADGVPADQVYETLGTKAGLLRAFAKLDSIKADILWWEKGFEPLRLIADGKAAMATAFNGRAFFWAMRKEPSLRILWSGQIYDFDLWAIPKSSKRKEEARQFIAFATAPERMADLAKLVPYGPLRRSAVAKVGRHSELGVEMKPFLPTTRQAMKSALAFDGTWWSKNEARVAEMFDKWLKGELLTKPSDEAESSDSGTGATD